MKQYSGGKKYSGPVMSMEIWIAYLIFAVAISGVKKKNNPQNTFQITWTQERQKVVFTHLENRISGSKARSLTLKKFICRFLMGSPRGVAGADTISVWTPEFTVFGAEGTQGSSHILHLPAVQPESVAAPRESSSSPRW